MIDSENRIFTRKHIINAVLVILLIADVVGFTEYRIHSLLGNVSGQVQGEKIEKEGLESRITKLEGEIEIIREENQQVLGTASDIQNEIGDISDTVGALDRLSKTDPELLQKYSKSYFLNEHYVPTEVTGINPAFTYAPKGEVLQIHAGIYQHLDDLLNDARDEGLDLGIVSAYRTFGYQSQLKDSYIVTYGAGTANQFSAEQGYSEHQLGTTVDFATKATAATLAGFNLKPEYLWLTNNAYKYGFILSYPPTNVYYEFEPWHWRYVGVALAKRLHNENRYFYDFDQREINTYLGQFFD
jgi:D-alanyl-D-alanine carboxypeptidase